MYHCGINVIYIHVVKINSCYPSILFTYDIHAMNVPDVELVATNNSVLFMDTRQMRCYKQALCISNTYEKFKSSACQCKAERCTSVLADMIEENNLQHEPKQKETKATANICVIIITILSSSLS